MAPRGVADEPRAPRVLRWQRRRLALLRAVAADSPAARGALPVEVLVEKVQSFGGRVLELGRSGLIGVFGLDPIEEAPRSAALAATAIVKAAEHHHRATGAGTGVRVGLHADQLLVGHLDGVPSLDSESRRAAIEILERVVAVAPPDVIALSSGAAALVERRFDVVPLASGENGVGPVYRLAGRERAGLDVEGRMTPFAGRRHEAALLDAVLATATTGRGQIVGIVGEAGIGKSRLLHEFRQSLAGRGVTYLAGQCVSYGAATPYLPALEMLRDACRLTEADTPESTAEKLRWHLTEIGMDAPEAAPYLLRLLGVREGTERLAPLTPEAVTTRTFDVLREMALAGSRRRPLVLAVENLHWIDASTEAYFGALADSLAGAPILLVCTFRPGRRPAWMDRSYATQVALAPLSREDSLAVVRSLPQASAIPPALADVIVDKADGNPFFLEELGRVVAQRPGAEESIEIPGTLQDVLLARMDRLAPETRRLLQVSAVVGREGPVRLLEAVWDGEGVAAPLGELKRLEFLDERLRGEETSFVFRHVLTHEVAYESLLPAERAQLHAAVGRVLEETHAGRLDEASGTLAHHFSRAGDAARAVEYLRRFADGAARSYAHAEAVTSLRAARAHAERLPAGRDAVLADLVLREGRSLHFLGRFAENRELLAQHAALVARLASPAANGHYHLLAGLTASHLGDPEAAAESASLAIAAAGACGDTRTLGRAHVLVGVGTLWSGRLREGLEHCRAATAVLDAAQDPSWLGQAHYVTGLLHFMRGEFPEALAAEAEADAIGAAAGDRRLRTHAAWTTGLVEVYGGRPAEGIACCQRAVEAAPDSFSAAAAESFLGCALKEAGRFDEAIERLEAAARRLERFRFRQQQGLATAWLSEALLGAGDAARAASAAARAVEITDEARYAAGAAVARRAVGRAALARGDAPTAVTALQDALARFQSMEMAYEAARTEHALTEALVATLNHS
ncbi:MAG: AAA family ATPase [Candidatus Rokubacteria bacterium]|nr:AAA family ATPase [Candidatus Rokubacteria bacterium]